MRKKRREGRRGIRRRDGETEKRIDIGEGKKR